MMRRAVAWGILWVGCLIVGLTAVADESAYPDLAGRWVMVQTLAAVGDLPFVGEISLVSTVMVLVDVEQNGDTLTMHDRYCRTEIELDTDLFTSQVPDLFMDALDPPARTVTLAWQSDTLGVTQDWHLEIRGAVLDDPENDPLPTNAYDRRVFDQDGDGFPALTVPVSLANIVTGDTYVVQRVRYRLDGVLIDEDTIEGSLEWTTEQTIVAATDFILTLPFKTMIDPDPTKHHFAMYRVDDSWTCATARERIDLLAPRDEP